MSDMFGNPTTDETTATLAFPQSLEEKYTPKRVGDFVGLASVQTALKTFLENPYPSAWLFEGDSGCGKTSMALAMVAQLPADLRHVPSREMDLANVETIAYHCNFMPWAGKKMHLVLVDEANEMTRPAQDAWLSKLDASGRLPNTVVVFTTNGTHNLLPRFLSRCRRIKFDSQHTVAELAAFLASIWVKEERQLADAPNFETIAREASGNIRESLMKLELALLGLRDPEPVVTPAPASQPVSIRSGRHCHRCGAGILAKNRVCDSCLLKGTSRAKLKATTSQGAA